MTRPDDHRRRRIAAIPNSASTPALRFMVKEKN